MSVRDIERTSNGELQTWNSSACRVWRLTSGIYGWNIHTSIISFQKWKIDLPQYRGFLAYSSSSTIRHGFFAPKWWWNPHVWRLCPAMLAAKLPNVVGTNLKLLVLKVETRFFGHHLFFLISSPNQILKRPEKTSTKSPYKSALNSTRVSSRLAIDLLIAFLVVAVFFAPERWVTKTWNMWDLKKDFKGFHRVRFSWELMGFTRDLMVI